MSDTPETDDLIPQFLAGGEIPDIFALARKLERERDEAITRRLETIMQCELYEQERDEVTKDLEFRRELYKVQEQYLETVRRERDEAREERIYAENEMRKWMGFAQGAALHRDEAIKAFKELWQMSETLLPEISEEQSDKWHKVIFTK